MGELTNLEKFCYAFTGLTAEEYARRAIEKWQEHLGKEEELSLSKVANA